MLSQAKLVRTSATDHRPQGAELLLGCGLPAACRRGYLLGTWPCRTRFGVTARLLVGFGWDGAPYAACYEGGPVLRRPQPADGYVSRLAIAATVLVLSPLLRLSGLGLADTMKFPWVRDGAGSRFGAFPMARAMVTSGPSMIVPT
jgi:hypothetical protein